MNVTHFFRWRKFRMACGWFAHVAEFQRGRKYVESYNYDEATIAEDGPVTVEWEIREATS